MSDSAQFCCSCLQKGNFDLWARPRGRQAVCRGRPLLALGRTLREVVDYSGSATCHVVHSYAHTPQWDIICCLPPGSNHIRPHSSHFGISRCLVFVNFLSFSNRRFPYLGLVGIFAAQNIHYGFLFQFCPTGDIGRDPIQLHTPSQVPVAVGHPSHV